MRRMLNDPDVGIAVCYFFNSKGTRTTQNNQGHPKYRHDSRNNAEADGLNAYRSLGSGKIKFVNSPKENNEVGDSCWSDRAVSELVSCGGYGGCEDGSIGSICDWGM